MKKYAKEHLFSSIFIWFWHLSSYCSLFTKTLYPFIYFTPICYTSKPIAIRLYLGIYINDWGDEYKDFNKRKTQQFWVQISPPLLGPEDEQNLLSCCHRYHTQYRHQYYSTDWWQLESHLLTCLSGTYLIWT